MNGTDNKEHVICPRCGEKVPAGKFCTDCGAPLLGAPMTTPPAEQKPIANPGPAPKIFVPLDDSGNPLEGSAPAGPVPVDDKALTFLGEFCQKTVATVGGDGYDETVLYEDEANGTFQIHTYSKYVFMQKESHRSYKAKEGAYDALLKLVEKLKLDRYEGKTGIGLCGGIYICKYKKDGVVHAVSTNNCGPEGSSLISQVRKLLGEYVGEEIFKEP